MSEDASKKEDRGNKTKKGMDRTENDKKPSFRVAHGVELALAAILGALASKLYDVISSVQTLIGTQTLIIVLALFVFVLIGLSFFSAIMVYIVNWAQWKLGHSKSRGKPNRKKDRL
jgi:membrane glycosyltransferase